MGADVTGPLETGRIVDGGQVRNSRERADTRDGHQATTSLISSYCLEHHLVQHRALLTQDCARNKHGLDHGQKPRLVIDQLKYARLERGLGDAPCQLQAKTRKVPRISFSISICLV